VNDAHDVNDRRPFHRIVTHLEYPMFVLTVADGAQRSGCLVGFVTQCSIDPPHYLVCVSKANHTFPIAARADVFVVHALHERDRALAKWFGELTGDEVDKFANVDWGPGPGGTPVLDGIDWFAGRVLDRVDGGDHVGFVLDVLAGGRAERVDEPQLGFQATRDFEPGHPA
jgi:flavin reductase (DIM6/NTAB) family NADH-FMN oxidoreductase RutF